MAFNSSTALPVSECSSCSFIDAEYNFSTIVWGAFPGLKPGILTLRTKSAITLAFSSSTCSGEKVIIIFFLVSPMFSIFVFIINKFTALAKRRSRTQRFFCKRLYILE